MTKIQYWALGGSFLCVLVSSFLLGWTFGRANGIGQAAEDSDRRWKAIEQLESELARIEAHIQEMPDKTPEPGK